MRAERDDSGETGATPDDRSVPQMACQHGAARASCSVPSRIAESCDALERFGDTVSRSRRATAIGDGCEGHIAAARSREESHCRLVVCLASARHCFCRGASSSSSEVLTIAPRTQSRPSRLSDAAQSSGESIVRSMSSSLVRAIWRSSMMEICSGDSGFSGSSPSPSVSESSSSP
jgi:hypothetical protein